MNNVYWQSNKTNLSGQKFSKYFVSCILHNWINLDMHIRNVGVKWGILRFSFLFPDSKQTAPPRVWSRCRGGAAWVLLLVRGGAFTQHSLNILAMVTIIVINVDKWIHRPGRLRLVIDIAAYRLSKLLHPGRLAEEGCQQSNTEICPKAKAGVNPGEKQQTIVI